MAAAPRHDQEDLVRHAGADAAEEFAGEIGLSPFSATGVHIELKEAVPMRFGDITAGEPVEGDPFIRHRRALLAQIFALGGRQLAQELAEIAVAAIAPVKLPVRA